jgi:hypothetical protein
MKKAISYSILLFFRAISLLVSKHAVFYDFFIGNVQNFNYIKIPSNLGIQ